MTSRGARGGTGPHWVDGGTAVLGGGVHGPSGGVHGVGGFGSSGVGPGSSRITWAQRLGSNLPSTWSKNVLEVVLEKDDRGAFIVNEEDCAKLLTKLGIDQRPGVHLEMVQICPNGRGVILITLKKEVQIERFCRYDVLEVTASGIRTVMVKVAGKREVVVNMKGLHPNTRDETVMDYLGKYGKVVPSKVIYGTFSTGPLRGVRNGDRSYKVEIKPGENIGTYHIIDNHKVTVRYAGQQQTCARCHGTPQHCLGKGIARNCQAAGGQKVELTDYILNLWERIGYSPQDFEAGDLAQSDDEHGEVGPVIYQQTGGNFTPPKTNIDTTQYSGVKVKSFPVDADHEDIRTFLVASGLPKDKKDNALIKADGSVTIMNLTSEECLSLIKVIHHNIHYGHRMFCNGVIALTPEKAATSDIPANKPVTSSPHSNSELTTNSSDSASLTPVTADDKSKEDTEIVPPLPVNPTSIPSPAKSPNQSFLDLGAASVITQLDDQFLGNVDFVRRRSLSMRDVHPGSIADEILQHISLKERSNKLLSDIKDMSKKMSDFESAQESLSASSSEESEPLPTLDLPFQTMNQKKKKYRNKRKNSQTPNKETFLKKSNMSASPSLNLKGNPPASPARSQ